MKKIKISIIGLGKIGMLYDYNKSKKKFILSHLNSIFANKKFQLVSCVDKNRSIRKKFKLKYKINCYNSIKSAFKEEIPEAVVISTSTNQHLKNVREIIKYKKIKSILCEKPLSNKYLESKKIIELCKKNKINLMVNYFRNFDKEFIRSVDILKKNIGFPLVGNVFYAKGVKNNCTHYISILERILGKVTDINIIHAGKKIQNDFEPEFDLFYKKGRVHFVPLDEKNFSYFEIVLFGKKGIYKMSRDSDKIQIKLKTRDDIYENYKSIKSFKNFRLNIKKSQSEVIDFFYKMIKKNVSVSSLINIKENNRVLHLIEKKLKNEI